MTLRGIFNEKAKADRNRSEFVAICNRLASSCYSTVPPITCIKTLSSICKKAFLCREEPTDILRGRVYVDDIDAFYKAKTLLKHNKDVYKVKDNFFADKPEKCGMPYILAKLKIHGSPCEIQIVYSKTPDLYAESHRLYKRVQFRESVQEITGIALPVDALNDRRRDIHAQIREAIPLRLVAAA